MKKSSFFCFLVLLSFAVAAHGLSCNNENDGTWTQINRANGAYCLMPIHGSLSRYEAYDKCSDYGGQLAGIENSQELQTFASLAEKQYRRFYPNVENVKFWIGGLRKVECRNGASCSTPYLYSDQFLKGAGYFNWKQGEPAQSKHNNFANCVTINIKDKTMEADVCQDKMQGYVCGRKAR